MRETTEKSKKKKGALICAAVVITGLLLYLAAALFPLINDSFGDNIALAFLGVYSLIIAAVVIGVLIALKQRFQEIEGGEEEDAKKY